MAPSYLVLWQCPACRHFWSDLRRVVSDSSCPECGVSDVDALTWTSSEDEQRLLTLSEMREDIDRQMHDLRVMGRGSHPLPD